MSGDLAAFLRARLDEDKAVAEEASGHSIFDGTGIVTQRNPSTTKTVVIGSHVARYIARWDPARVLAEVQAKRHIIETHQREDHYCPIPVIVGPHGQRWDDGPCYTLRLLALPYDTHPDYREEWRP